ncbi:surfeit locus protein 1-like isoform X2 [Arabidopsis lyrata subsp. lyrata]|uniref:surfeit locus protein 1-like isoform X2 n=1 Tax=Arabidopsis lyrata subsp. lyrata TaxID=81972 RepID=UPI000A29B3A3|nr:surfeit locus protein 1-like isoform X2 [Arabidopsis lyrata subsp. lyrata]|eukprot:XP_020869710.1 surfeit locus protein 1-like isoform X2 [Arabidopsis lyrata subsp. lyrata]
MKDLIKPLLVVIDFNQKFTGSRILKETKRRILEETRMTKLVSKTLTRLISQSQYMSSSTTSNLPATSNLETQLLSSVPPPAKKKRGSALLWYLVGFTTYGLGETYKFLQTDLYKKHLDFRRQCLETKPMKLNTMKNVDELGFRRVVCKGVFDEQRSIYVGPKPRSMSKGSENGFYVITPLLPIPNEPNSMKSPILVNRGWVPSDWKEKSLESLGTGVVVAAANEARKSNKILSSQQNLLSKFWCKFNNPTIAEDQVSGAMHVEVVGVIRKSETPGIYTLVNYPSSLAWFYLDVPKLAQAMGFSEDTMYIENIYKDMDESRPYPAPRDVENLIRSKDIPLDYHLYTVLWHWSSLTCFIKASSILMRKFTKSDPVGIEPILIPICILFFICTKIYSLRNLFCKVDTIGVGCLTKLEPGKDMPNEG